MSEPHRVRRGAARARYDEATLHAILDAGLVAHVGIEVDGQPFVLPMAYARDGDALLLHGSRASRTMKALMAGSPACVTVTLLDGLVLARSAFHHSMNYRSVVVLGTATPIEDPDARASAFVRLVEHVAPGRAAEVRMPNEAEDRQTAMVRIPLAQASAKVRTGPPVDDEADYAGPWWAGVLPFSHDAVEVEPDPKLAAGIEVPASVRVWKRSRPGG